MRKGENALKVLEGVRAKTADINATLLPPGTRIAPFYDRATLVHHTVRTVQENLAIGAALVLETSGDQQVRGVAALMEKAGFGVVETRRDLAGVERFVAGKIR